MKELGHNKEEESPLAFLSRNSGEVAGSTLLQLEFHSLLDVHIITLVKNRLFPIQKLGALLSFLTVKFYSSAEEIFFFETKVLKK